MLRRRAVAGLALAASLLLLVLARREPAALASRLGGVAVAPTYLGIQLRGESSAADSVFQAGMNDYMERRYSHAVTFFRRSRSVDGDHARDDFFLGVSLLMTNEPVAAGESFSRVVRLGESPYRSEAYFYRAKARLRLGRIDEALGDLALAVSRRDDNSSNAAALADSVRGVAGRR